jgi:putative transcriptional regulator
MNPHEDLLLGFALGELDDAGMRAFELACRASPSLAEEALALRESLAIVGALGPDVAPPSATLRARILAAAEGRGTLASWADRLAQFFEISVDKARALLDAASEPDTWELDSLPGVGLIHLSAGPRLAGADAGLVRFPAGLHWPMHRHLGEERMLILSGGFRDDAGRTWGPGDELVMTPGSMHALDIVGDRPCVSAVTLFEGLEMPPGTRVPH